MARAALTMIVSQPLQDQADVKRDDSANNGNFFDIQIHTGQAGGELVECHADARSSSLEFAQALCAGRLQRGGECA